MPFARWRRCRGSAQEPTRGPAPRGMYWMRTQAQLYRQLRRERDAEAIEAELLKLLAYADPDYPLLQQIKSASQDLSKARAPVRIAGDAPRPLSSPKR